MSAFERGLDHFRAARYEQARAEFHVACSQEPGNPQAWRYLAAAYFSTGDYAGAEHPARQCVALTPGDPAAHLNLGIILRKLGLWEEAQRVLQECLRLRPDYEAARVEYAKLQTVAPAVDSYYTAPTHFDPLSD